MYVHLLYVIEFVGYFPNPLHTEEKQKQDPATQAEAKPGFFSYFMPWRRTERPPRAKLPSDSRPKVIHKALVCIFICVHVHVLMSLT